MSLPSPLTASDEWIKPRDLTVEVVRLTAGLHRQVWVSGTSIYVDVHIANNSRKTVKKIELQLERDILCYKHVCSAKSFVLAWDANGAAYRLPLLQWRNRQARLEYLTATSGLYSAKQLSSKALQGGMAFQRTRRTFAPATSKSRGAMVQ